MSPGDSAYAAELSALQIRDLLTREKVAIDPLTLTALLKGIGGVASKGVLPHLGINAATMAMRGSRLGRKVLSRGAQLGAHHGVTGRKVNPVLERAARYMVGPETVEEYYMGRAMGKGVRKAMSSRGSSREVLEKYLGHGANERKIKAMRGGGLMLKGMRGAAGLAGKSSKATRVAALRGLGKAVSSSQTMKDMPMGYAMQHLGKRLAQSSNPIRAFEPKSSLARRMMRPKGRVGRMIAKGTTVPGNAKPTLKQNLLSGALGTGALAASPGHMGGHFMFTGARNMMSASTLAAREVPRGFAKGTRTGGPGRFRSLVTGIGLSPALLDAERAGGALRKSVQRHTAQLPSIQKVLNDMRGL